MNNNNKYILCFGSLKSGFWNFNRFGQNTQKLIKTFKLKNFEMYNLGPYPAVCPGSGEITVELHEIKNNRIFETIKEMEEGAGYSPVQVKTELEGKQVIATIYTWPKNRLLKYPKIESGNWEG